MKKADFLKVLADRSGLPVEKITEFVTSENEEIEATIQDVHIFTNEQLEDRLKNHANASSKTFIEMAIKDARNKLVEKYGQEAMFEGKNIDNLVAKVMELGKKEAGTKPNDKIIELEGVIKKLQETQGTLESEWKTKYDVLEQKHASLKDSMFIRSIIPNNLETNLSHDKIAALFNLDIKTKEENGQRIFTDVNGNVFRDSKTQNPLSEKEVVQSWLETNGFKMKQTDGRGEGNQHGNLAGSISTIKSTEDFYNYCKQNNVPSSEYPKILREVQKTTPDFLLE